MTEFMKGLASMLRAAIVGLLLLHTGCGTDGSDNVVEISTSDLPPSAGTDTAGHWQSSDWDAGWIAYEAETSLRIEHPLGRRPSSVLVYISFSPDGHAAGMAVGDSARIIAITETHVTIQNALRENFFARVVLQ